MGVWAARTKRVELHHKCMRFSLTMAATPIGQRMYSGFCCTPAALALRVVVCARQLGTDGLTHFSHFRWGSPDNALWSDGCLLDHAAEIEMVVDRARPYLFSLDGYGEGEQLSFATSAWMSLITMLFLGLLPFLNSKKSSQSNGKEEQPFEEWRMLDVWRERCKNAIQALDNIRPERHAPWPWWTLKWASLVSVLGASLGLGALIMVVIAVTATLFLTMVNMGVMLAGPTILAIIYNTFKMMF